MILGKILLVGENWHTPINICKGKIFILEGIVVREKNRGGGMRISTRRGAEICTTLILGPVGRTDNPRRKSRKHKKRDLSKTCNLIFFKYVLICLCDEHSVQTACLIYY